MKNTTKTTDGAPQNFGKNFGEKCVGALIIIVGIVEMIRDTPRWVSRRFGISPKPAKTMRSNWVQAYKRG